ncbi:MAG: hypothetical protein RLZZ362_1737 [Actinomycetota bacterium]|jgi:tetratricopeptide (TPR) repeat protein
MAWTEFDESIDEALGLTPAAPAAAVVSKLEETEPVVAERRRAPGWLLAIGAVVLLAGAFSVGRATAPESVGTSVSSSESADTEPTPDASRLLAVGMELHNRGDLNAAEQAYQRVLDLVAEDPYALYNLGLIRQTQGDLAAALGFYDRSLASDSTLVSAQYNRALARRDTGDAAGAIDDLEAVVSAQPENAGALYNLGNLKIAGGDIDGGTKLVTQAIEIDPTLRGDQ